MDVRGASARLAAVLLLSGATLIAGPSALAQEADPCAPAADGSVPEMCQGGMAPEPAPSPEPEPSAEPEPDPCAPDAEGVAPEMCQGGQTPEPAPDPSNPCPPQPVEPGDGVIVDEGDQGVAVGEPDPGAPVEEGQAQPEPAPEEPVSEDPSTDAPTMTGPIMDAPVVGDPTVICAFGMPVAAPVDAAAPEAAAGGGTSTAAGAANGAVAAGQLPRTGPKERLAALAAAGLALLLVGAGANAAGRRRLLEV